MTETKPPDLRRIRIPLIWALDLLPSRGPEWHPTFKAALRVREDVNLGKREVEPYLGPEE